MKKIKQNIAVIDFETDPFKAGRIPVPFAWGFYDGTIYKDHWTRNAWETPDQCADELIKYIGDIEEPFLILAHNGGKFDFLFIIKHLTGAIKIVNGRILQAELGVHTLRDSYAILPIPLSQSGGKMEIDYMLMERNVRESHRAEIMTYLKADCKSLYDLAVAFYSEFGDALTIGGTAMKQLKSFHKFESGHEKFDQQFRPYYFGGRCQCFETGVIETGIKGIDINSSYPDTMRRLLHPVSVAHIVSQKIGTHTMFVKWQGKNFNAVPVREKFGLNFNTDYGIFNTTIHEFNAGLETGTIEPDKIIETVSFREVQTFENFVDHFYNARLKAKADDNVFLALFYKLILNSSYGKFAQSPDNFKDSIILPWGEVAPAPFEIEFTHGEYAIWSKPSLQKTYFNVATAASITGGARANLLFGLSNAVRPLYCDTDSIYCEDFTGELDDKKLGKWKLEFEGTSIAIAGKKLYAVMGQDETGNTVCLKKASKGTRLNPLAIYMIARGDTVETVNDAPTFKLDGNHQFINRRIRNTNLINQGK